jgi:ATP-dependent protease Clp ATPase subunit
LPYEERAYQMINDQTKLLHTIGDYIDEYNIVHPGSQLTVVIFNHFTELLLSICRILRMQRTNAMLIGVSGCGKQTASKLASFIS